MVLIKAKLDGFETKGQLERERVQKWLKAQLEKAPRQLLFGCRGMGKTTALLSFIRKNYRNRYGYYCLDDCDNNIAQFQAYFVAMIKNAGIFAKENLKEVKLHEMICMILKALEDDKEKRILVFDGVDCLRNLEIIEALLFFIKYVNSLCAVILVCDNMVQDEFKQVCYEGRLAVLAAEQIVFNKEELSRYLFSMRWHMQKEELQMIYKYSGGWPGIFCLMEQFWKKSKRKGEIENIILFPLLHEYLYRTIWIYQSEVQQMILIYASLFPYVDEEFFRDIVKIALRNDELLWLVHSGILIYEQDTGYYQIRDMMKSFMEKTVPNDGHIDDQIIREAAYWYDKKGLTKEAVLCFNTMKEKEELSAYLVSHVQEIMLGLEYEELRGCLQYEKDREGRPEEWFLQGILLLHDEKYEQVHVIQQRLKERYHSTKEEEKKRVAELLLNLLYQNSRIGVKEWIGVAERYLDEKEKVHLYTLTNKGINICCGAKNLSSFFTEGIKQQREYKKRWKMIVCEEQEGCFDIAEIEYLLETNREKQAVEKLQEILAQTQDYSEQNQLIGIYGIMCKLYRKKVNDSFYEITMYFIETQLKSRHNLWMDRNMKACRIYYEAWRDGRDQLAYWIRYDAPENGEHITYENAYVHMIKGIGFLSFHQYDKAYPILENVSFFYKRKNNLLYLIKSIFGQAVALYGLNRHTEALKLATEAITLGAKYRYVGIYTEFGKIGYELIRLYQQVIKGGEEKRSGKKKKYYYGNILHASYEDYQSILLRCAKKEMRHYAAEENVEKDRLTTTELLVLKAVSSGMSNREIADEMNIKQTTVKTHLYTIYRKLDVKSRVAAVNRAKESGIL